MEGVGVRRGASHLLDGLDWDVDHLERWAVIGPNGAGKTTALTIAATRMFPTVGRVEVLGETLGRVDVNEIRPRIGLSSSGLVRDLPMHESAIDVILTGAYAVTGRWREEYHAQDVERAWALLRDWGGARYADRPFASLSEGERKRVLLARALMSDPELLLLDEPGAGLDLAGREELVALLGAFASNPASPTLILVTHHLEEIPPGISHALLLAGGRVVAQGAVGDVLTDGNLSTAYGIPLTVTHLAGRWVATHRGFR
jgi:iron complex transport system ATP-binding protein